MALEGINGNSRVYLGLEGCRHISHSHDRVVALVPIGGPIGVAVGGPVHGHVCSPRLVRCLPSGKYDAEDDSMSGAEKVAVVAPPGTRRTTPITLR